MRYERNNDPSYYEEFCDYSNCGSFALNLQGWYDPEEYFYTEIGDTEEWIFNLYDEGYSEEEISNFYANHLITGMLIEFNGELREAPDWKLKPNEELIAFRTFCIICDDEYTRRDFHFKVFRDGTWMEKNGWTPVHTCDEDEWNDYISDTFYLAHKIFN